MADNFDEDFYDEDISPVSEQVQGQTKWEQIQNHPHFRKAVFVGLGIFIFIVICIVAGVVLLSLFTSDDSGSNDNNNNNNTIPIMSSDSTIDYSTYYYETTHSSVQSDCSNYYGDEEIGWSYGIMIDLGSSGSRVSIFEWKETEPVQSAPQNGIIKKQHYNYYFSNEKYRTTILVQKNTSWRFKFCISCRCC